MPLVPQLQLSNLGGGSTNLRPRMAQETGSVVLPQATTPRTVTRDVGSPRMSMPCVPRLQLSGLNRSVVGGDCCGASVQHSLSLREHATCESFGSMVAPGDIVYVKGSGRFQNIGANGGLMGHVMVALAPPVLVERRSALARTLTPLWPCGVPCLWRVRTLESTRSTSGLHEAEMLVHVDSCSHRMFLVGELSLDHSELSSVDMESVQIWQSPKALRDHMNQEIVEAVLGDMIAHDGDWSYVTAARALVLSGDCCCSETSAALLHEAKACWQSAPICTSVAIVFWQRYLCKFGRRCRTNSCDPADLIRNYMPLKADRTLPGTLQQVLRQCQWRIRERIPQKDGL